MSWSCGGWWTYFNSGLMVLALKIYNGHPNGWHIYAEAKMKQITGKG